uniref:Uncharacterized protein n=1 Tax=Arundo donax TaxID=35708 RepID=A0A0A8XVM2_ARUDO
MITKSRCMLSESIYNLYYALHFCFFCFAMCQLYYALLFRCDNVESRNDRLICTLFFFCLSH